MAKFNWKDFLKRLAVIAIPVALQNLLTTTASMVDTMMVAPLGELSVGALGLCAQFSSLMFSCYWGFVGGGGLFFAQYWGAKDDDGINRSYGITLLFMMIVAVTFAILGIFAPGLIMRLYTDKESIRQIGVQYLRIVGFAYILQVLSMAMSVLLRSTERVRIPLYASIASVATNLLLNWILIFGRLGFPALGIQGAAIATVSAAVVNVLVIYILSARIRYPYLFQIKSHFRWDRAFIGLYLKKCFPIICNELLIGVGNMVINITLGRQPEYVIAAVAVFRTLEGLIIGFFAGFSNAASVLVGKLVGAGDLETAYERAKRLIYLCSLVIFSVGLMIFALHKPILTAMSLSGESYTAGTVILTIYLFVSLIRMGNWIHNDTYRSAGDAVYGTVLEIAFMYGMLLPAVLLAGFYFHAPYWVVFLCCYIDEPIRYVLMQIHFYSGKWIKPVTEQGKAALDAFMEKRRKKTGVPL
ncbi:MAG: MATE family efflux transporter [Firmicutes bacterium]|nr:MATE family efflux transporter [Bacillota bacterium]